ncbi:MAG: hypothetical protein MHMPM18_001093 [Marteilia pararefringens]
MLKFEGLLIVSLIKAVMISTILGSEIENFVENSEEILEADDQEAPEIIENEEGEIQRAFTSIWTLLLVLLMNSAIVFGLRTNRSENSAAISDASLNSPRQKSSIDQKAKPSEAQILFDNSWTVI